MRKIAAIILTVASGIVISLGAASRATASIITWGTPTTISATSDVDLTGPLVYAYDMGSSSAVTVNGVAFTAWAPSTFPSDSEVLSPNATLAASGTTSGNFSGAGNSHSGGAVAALYTADPNYWTLLDTEVFTTGGTDTLTLTLNNLLPGRPYEFEMWVDDSRPGTLYLRTDDVSTVGGPTTTLSFATTHDGDGANGVGQFVIGTFTADATTQAISIVGGGTNPSAQIGAFQLREVPEPASLALLSLGTAAIVGRRNRSRVAR